MPELSGASAPPLHLLQFVVENLPLAGARPDRAVAPERQADQADDHEQTAT